MTQIRNKNDAPPEPVRCCDDLKGLLEPRFFKALCDPSRITLLAELVQCGRTCTVGELAAGSRVSLSVVSRHLAVLREAGILTARKEGRQVNYTVRYGQLVRTLRAMADAIEACCGDDEPLPGTLAIEPRGEP